jgi:hypothetical protein
MYILIYIVIIKSLEVWAMDNVKETTILIRKVPVSTRQAMKVKAAQEGRSMQAVLIALINDYIREDEKHG